MNERGTGSVQNGLLKSNRGEIWGAWRGTGDPQRRHLSKHDTQPISYCSYSKSRWRIARSSAWHLSLQMGRNLLGGAKCSCKKRLMRFLGQGGGTKALEETIRCHPTDSDPSITGRKMPSRRIL